MQIKYSKIPEKSASLNQKSTCQKSCHSSLTMPLFGFRLATLCNRYNEELLYQCRRSRDKKLNSVDCKINVFMSFLVEWYRFWSSDFFLILHFFTLIWDSAEQSYDESSNVAIPVSGILTSFSGRSIQVIVDGHASNLQKINAGELQSSAIAPGLFPFQFNDSLLTTNKLINSFAYDSRLQHFISWRDWSLQRHSAGIYISLSTGELNHSNTIVLSVYEEARKSLPNNKEWPGIDSQELFQAWFQHQYHLAWSCYGSEYGYRKEVEISVHSA